MPKLRSIVIGIPLAFCASLLPAIGARAELNPPAPVGAFFESHCIDCHDDLMLKGGLDLTALPFDTEDAHLFSKWVRIYDRVQSGEMPPKNPPAQAEIDQFLVDLGDPLEAADNVRAANRGRSTLRRLNRYEYENNLRALFAAPWLHVKDMLPEDGEAHRFNKVGEALDISHVQMAQYIAAAENAMRQVLASEAAERTTVRYFAREQRSFIRRMTYSPFNQSPERTTTPLLDHTAQPDVINEELRVSVGAKDPETREREAFGVVNGNYVGNKFYYDDFSTEVGGRYRLSAKAYTYWAGPGGKGRWWKPDRDVAFPGRRSEPVTLYAFTPPNDMRRLLTFDAKPEPDVFTFEVNLLPGESIKPDAARLFRSRPGWRGNPLATREGMPGVAYAWIEVEGPLAPEHPGHATTLLFDDLPFKFGKHGELAVATTDARGDAARLIKNFLHASARRPLMDGDVALFTDFAHRALNDGVAFADALLSAYAAILSSPGYIYLQEEPGALDGYALAARLSYFLWNGPPDADLMALAKSGEIVEVDRLSEEAGRLLEDAKTQRFMDSFLAYWLDLRKIGDTTPDSTLYPDYYLDDLLTESAEEETRRFFAELVAHDLPAHTLIDSDFIFINERLAEHYDMAGFEGAALRKAPLPEDSPRGGLLGQASVLKVTANGTTTSPVLRGAWIMERILGDTPPPPPPSIPAIEPDTRGATTIREQLDKHRADPSCASCHNKIDPPGLALESFDVAGAWRNQYRAVNEEAAPAKGIGKNGHVFAFHHGPPVDPSGVLPGERSFADINEFRALLLEDKRQIARSLTHQFIVYATGAPVRFGDRGEVERILDAAEASEYGVRTLIHETVRSSLFRNK